MLRHRNDGDLSVVVTCRLDYLGKGRGGGLDQGNRSGTVFWTLAALQRSMDRETNYTRLYAKGSSANTGGKWPRVWPRVSRHHVFVGPRVVQEKIVGGPVYC